MAKLAGCGPLSAYQPWEPSRFDLNQQPPRRIANLVCPSLRSLSVHSQTFPHMSYIPNGERPSGNAFTGVVVPVSPQLQSPRLNVLPHG